MVETGGLESVLPSLVPRISNRLTHAKMPHSGCIYVPLVPTGHQPDTLSDTKTNRPQNRWKDRSSAQVAGRDVRPATFILLVDL